MIKRIHSNSNRIFLISLFTIYSLGLTGCAINTLHDNLPKYSYNHIKKIQKKVSVDYDYTTNYFVQPANDAYSDNFYSIVKNAFAESKIFENYYQGIGNEPYHLSIKCRISPNMIGMFTTIELHALTLTLFPVYAPVNLTLTVDVSKNGEIVKSYRYDDGWSSWRSFFLIISPNNHKHPYEEVLGNMLRNFLYDMQNDSILQ